MSVLAVDLGFEFVDLALEAGGRVSIVKHPVGDRAPADAALAAIARLSAELSFDIASLEAVRFGATSAINALIARQGARIALITTTGFADTLYLGRQNRRDLYDPVACPATPAFLVAPDDIHEVDGRLDAAGSQVRPLDETRLAIIAGTLAERPVDAVAVCLLHAHREPAHERAVREALASRFEGVPIILSHEIDPHPREFERTVSACLEAWLQPLQARILDRLSSGLAVLGFSGSLDLADSLGTLVPQRQARHRASDLVMSGPAAAVRHAASLLAAADIDAAITVDIGSTTTDISVLRGGSPAFVSSAEHAGVPMRRRMIDLGSLALGGRTRAAADGVGGVRLRPPPGGDGPTLHDCLAFLRRLPLPASDGTTQRLASLGTSLGEADAEAAALRVVEAGEQAAATAILRHAVGHNLDPARATLVAMGGLGGVLGAGVAARLGVTRILVPERASLAGALGLLAMSANPSARIRVDMEPAALGDEGLRRCLESLRAMLPGGGRAGHERLVAEMAATAALHPLEIAFREPPSGAQAVAAAFAEQYEQRYGIRPPAGGHVFALTLSRVTQAPVRTETVPEPPGPACGMRALPGGTLWIPAGWTLSSGPGCHLLERSAA
ncbi:hydantoinase/oxoprolinase N-terminal domain-containing protein [Aureimonas populi]|uniref:Hydantoinase/oxoprolinase N-terminal domain-containing protein n=1 Tax=Aureimonas populi TaxID=1701758 RepID=A0ABW5CMU8_9HYPH|nr:hydantoinase/oxoprolinase family protein [Aureimonas populi]